MVTKDQNKDQAKGPDHEKDVQSAPEGDLSNSPGAPQKSEPSNQKDDQGVTHAKSGIEQTDVYYVSASPAPEDLPPEMAEGTNEPTYVTRPLPVEDQSDKG